ncbi:M4 family metallopeptidase [Microbulbifer sp.]|uniref:M4 family metallopeptidase n=1 Tax=Microbulbifer sp. TaxID=1908541 RepID=UPI002F951BFC
MSVMCFLPVRFRAAGVLTSIALLSACGGGGGGGGGGSDGDQQMVNNYRTVESGNYFRTQFTVEAGITYQIELGQQNCTASAAGDPSANNACCALMVSDPDSAEPSWEDGWHEMVAGPSSVLRLPFDPSVSGELKVAVYGINPSRLCQFDELEISASVDTAQSMHFLQGTGQNGKDYLVASTGIDGSNYFLRDVSRRASLAGSAGNVNAGELQAWANISSQRINSIEKESQYPLVEYQAGDSFWGGSNTDLVDAHGGTALVHDFFLQVLGINSFDGKGGAMRAYQDLPFPSEDTTFCGNPVPPNSLYNAFYFGGAIYYSTYGQRLSTYFYGPSGRPPRSLSAALDVTAHEWGHALTDRYSMLEYERESGALNEAFSDWIGVAVEWFRDGYVNWELGEDSGSVIRDMANPRRFGDPDTYFGTYWQRTDGAWCPIPDICENDYCGVHGNSGVANKMFSLLVEGGSHNGISVQGVGMETAIRIAVDANRYYWGATETFASARAGMESAAFNYGDEAVRQVGLAWQAVGVGGDPLQPVSL